MARDFDRAYYQRYYVDPDTRICQPDEHDKLARFVAAYLGHLGIEVATVLDLGCGVGTWRRLCREHLPSAVYTGVEISEHVCREHGWEHGSVVDYQSEEPADLVVCQGVLQYLRAREARRAIRNLSRLTGEALYLEVLTREDWEENCDQAATDGDVYLRPAQWYRSALEAHFLPIGGGLYLPRDGGVVLYELEHL